MKFLIFSPPYHEKNGGAIAQHKLCDLLTRAGHDACLFPMFENIEISPLNWGGATKLAIIEQLKLEQVFRNPKSFVLCDRYKTKLFQGDINQIPNDDRLVVVYPEITFGNPLGAKNVARWLLHNPGFHTGKIFYTKGEVQFLYSDRFTAIKDIYLEVAPDILNIVDIPWDLYSSTEDVGKRKGVAYLVKKGRGRKIIHDMTDSICIDNLSHEEIAKIFKSVEYFLSYDKASFYSNLAALSGAKSVIVSDEESPGGREGDSRRATLNGVAYGFGDVDRAVSTVSRMIDEMREQERQSESCVRSFINFWQNRLLNQGQSGTSARS